MIETIFSFLSATSSTVGAAVLAAMMLVSSFFGFATPPVIVSEVATSSTPAVPEVIPPLVVTPKPPPPIVTPPPVVVTPPPVVVPPVVTPPVATTTQTVGTTTLSVRKVPLLVGGTVHASGSVPVSYLQITNVGDGGALVTGFWVVQNGSAPGASVIGLSTVDDKGVIRDATGGTEGATPFQNGMAFAPTNAFFAPGQTRLFTIKAIMTQDVSPYIGMQLMIAVASVQTTAETKSQQFPIHGTTWVIAQ